MLSKLCRSFFVFQDFLPLFKGAYWSILRYYELRKKEKKCLWQQRFQFNFCFGDCKFIQHSLFILLLSLYVHELWIWGIWRYFVSKEKFGNTFNVTNLLSKYIMGWSIWRKKTQIKSLIFLDMFNMSFFNIVYLQINSAKTKN